MIDPKQRLYAASGSLVTGGPYTWYITDFDTRRFFSVTYAPAVPLVTDEELEATEEICLEKLRKHVDHLGEGVVGIRFSELEGPITTSVDPADDVTHLVNSPYMSDLDFIFPIKTISISRLNELDRLGPQVDLVEYEESAPTHSVQAKRDSPGKTKVVFKYWLLGNGMFRTWHELNDWIQLPRDHPHIVPFDSVVLDGIKGRIVGFTSLFIPGGTLYDKNATVRPFRLKWFLQLLSVVNDLNYRYGIMHQDIAPRNLIIDEKDNLRIFDFNFSSRIAKHYSHDMDDLKGIVFTLYEMITLDTHRRLVPPREQDAEGLLRMEWVKHPDVKLDHEVKVFRQALDFWVNERKRREFKTLNTWLDWPTMPNPPKVHEPVMQLDGKILRVETTRPLYLLRRKLVKMDEDFWNWERPASYRLAEALDDKSVNSHSVEDLADEIGHLEMEKGEKGDGDGGCQIEQLPVYISLL